MRTGGLNVGRFLVSFVMHEELGVAISISYTYTETKLTFVL